MSTYSPDKWQIIKLTNEEHGTHYRVFAVWFGGYLDGDSWKMNSGITKASFTNDIYEFEGSSGSVYCCHANGYGTSGYGQGVLQQMIDDSKEFNTIMIMPADTNFLNLEYV